MADTPNASNGNYVETVRVFDGIHITRREFPDGTSREEWSNGICIDWGRPCKMPNLSKLMHNAKEPTA